jgi:hypothetical protein
MPNLTDPNAVELREPAIEPSGVGTGGIDPVRLQFTETTRDLPEDLEEALQAYLRSSAGLIAAFGKADFFGDLEPAGTALPYLVFTDSGDETASYQTESDDGSIGVNDYQTLQLTVYAASRAAARRLRRAVEKTLNDAPLLFTQGTLLYFRRAGRLVQKDPDPGPDGLDVWAGILTFAAITERTTATL